MVVKNRLSKQGCSRRSFDIVTSVLRWFEMMTVVILDAPPIERRGPRLLPLFPPLESRRACDSIETSGTWQK